MPTSSLAKMIIRRAMKRASSPASNILRQVVDGGLRIAAAHALDERADHVVVVVAAVSQRTGAERRLDVAELDRAGVGEGARDLQGGQHLAPVAAGAVDEVFDRFGGRGRPLRLQPAPHQHLDGLTVQRLQAEQRAPAAQWRVDLEERVLGRRSDHRQRAVLDGRAAIRPAGPC